MQKTAVLRFVAAGPEVGRLGQTSSPTKHILVPVLCTASLPGVFHFMLLLAQPFVIFFYLADHPVIRSGCWSGAPARKPK
jgi:hypothetical protein